MTSNSKLPDPHAALSRLQRPRFQVTPYIFGIQAVPLLGSGLFSLIFPAAMANFPNSPMQGLSMGTIQALSLTTLSLGTFYTIASYQNNTAMVMAAVPGRLLAMLVFYRAGGSWADVAPFEGAMGLMTAGGLWWDWWCGLRRGDGEGEDKGKDD